MWAMHTPYKFQLHLDFAWIRHLDLNISSKRTPSRSVWLRACHGNISDSPGNHEGLATPLQVCSCLASEAVLIMGEVFCPICIYCPIHIWNIPCAYTHMGFPYTYGTIYICNIFTPQIKGIHQYT